MRKVRLDIEKIKSILICESGGCADTLRSAPYIRAARERFPHARISLLTTSWNQELFQRNPNVDEIVLLPERVRGETLPSKLRRLMGTLRTIRGKYDLVVGGPFRPRITAFLAFCSGARYRVGFHVNGLPFAWNLDRGAVDYRLSQEERRDRLWQALGINVVDPSLEFRLSPDDEAAVDRMLSECGIRSSDPLLGIHAGTDWACQRWHPGAWAELVQQVSSQYPGVRIVATGTEDDTPLYQEIRARGGTEFLDLSGKTTIGQLGALVKRYRAVVTVDSITPALAVAAGIPVVLLDMRKPPTWSMPRWPGVHTLQPPEWFRASAITRNCQVARVRRGSESCRAAVCLDPGAASLISALISVNEVTQQLEALLEGPATAPPAGG